MFNNIGRIMKKKIAGMITAIVIAAVAVIAGYNVYSTQNDNKLTDLALANVEALAQTEPGYWYECSWYGCLFDYRYDCHVYRGYLLIMTCENSRG